MSEQTIADGARVAKEDGRTRRKDVPRSSHGEWTAPPGRPDPVQIVEAQNEDRLPDLVPLRRGRMSASPFAFFRGSAAVMASDLSTTPTSGLEVQLCGDAHLSNFGVYGSPERNLVFDLNDFDETLPGPFEWDVKRLAASFAIAAQHRGFEGPVPRRLAESVATVYRSTMRDLADRGWLDGWYSHVSEDSLVEWVVQRGAPKATVKRIKKGARKARSRDQLRAATKLVEEVDGEYRFKSTPPVLIPIRALPRASEIDDVDAIVDAAFRQYRRSLDERTRRLVNRYQLVDVARKVVGVGSVGTRCWVALLMGRRPTDVLLLQIKEATSSVLERHLPASRYAFHGRRVVEGQRLMQASSDIFLGWSGAVLDHHYYWRQLKDWKGSVDIESVREIGLAHYAGICGYTLARSHAVSGDPAAIAGYLGTGSVFDRSIGEFAIRYARQNESDFEAFTTAIASGLSAEEER